MATPNNADWKREILTRLYDQHTNKPSAYAKLRLDPERFPTDDVEDFFQQLCGDNLIRGSVRHRNLKLTTDGIKYIEKNFPEILEAAS